MRVVDVRATLGPIAGLNAGYRLYACDGCGDERTLHTISTRPQHIECSMCSSVQWYYYIGPVPLESEINFHSISGNEGYYSKVITVGGRQ